MFIQAVKPEGQCPGCNLRLYVVFHSFGARLPGKDEGNSTTSRREIAGLSEHQTDKVNAKIMTMTFTFHITCITGIHST